MNAVCAYKIGTATCATGGLVRPRPRHSWCRTVDYAAPYTHDLRWCARSTTDTFRAQVRDFAPRPVP